MQLVHVGFVPPLLLKIPPPLPFAELLLIVQFVRIGLLLTAICIAPPDVAVFPLKLALMTVGLLELVIEMPPPELLLFLTNTQLIFVPLLLFK